MTTTTKIIPRSLALFEVASNDSFFHYLLCDHPQLLEVDQAVELRVVCEVNEGQVLLDDRVERDDRRLHLVPVEKVSISAHVAARVHQLLHLVEETLVFCRKLLPGKQ